LIDQIELRKIAAKFGLPSAVIEKDYVITKFLFLLYQNELKNVVALKGGTAIKKVFLIDFRFSEDLDFTSLKKTNFNDYIQEICLNSKDIHFEIKEFSKFAKSFKCRIMYNGPLNFPSSFYIDISMRENLKLNPKLSDVIHIFPDIQKFTILTMQLEEIWAEKCRAAYMRKKSRDFFDLYQLGINFDIKKNKEIIKELFFEKLNSLGLKYKPKPDLIERLDFKEIQFLIPKQFKINLEEIKSFLKENYDFLFS